MPSHIDAIKAATCATPHVAVLVRVVMILPPPIGDTAASDEGSQLLNNHNQSDHSRSSRKRRRDRQDSGAMPALPSRPRCREREPTKVTRPPATPPLTRRRERVLSEVPPLLSAMTAISGEVW